MTTTTAVYITDSPLGSIEIHSNGEAITCVSFTTSVGNTIHATAGHHEPLLQKCSQQLHEYFEGTRKIFDLPLQQRGTLFQQNVWRHLLDIDYGKTLSYLELSKKMGDPKAIRAVGTTNGKNQIAIIVPCHRVIGSDGSLTGYAGELWRKKWLLEHEGKYANGVQTLF